MAHLKEEEEEVLMHCFRKILFPVDFSSRCIDTSPFVAAIARKFESEVVLLHVFDNYRVLPYSARSAAVAYEAYEDLIWQRRAAELDSFGRYEFDSLKVTRVVETGDPADVITEYVEKHEQDLIVMPTHGHNKLRRLLLGSVTSKVLHDMIRGVPSGHRHMQRRCLPRLRTTFARLCARWTCIRVRSV